MAGLMLVYCVVIGDMLVGKEGYAGLLCGSLGGVFCGRPLVVGLTALFVLLPAISFRFPPPFTAKLKTGIPSS
jgi:hypothetical protein